MISRSNPTLQTVDPELLAQAMNRYVSSCSLTHLERGIVKSISTLDESHRGALARALTDDKLFADVRKVDESTLRETVQLSGRSGELRQSFLHFLKSNPRALEQLHPQIVNGIFADMETPRVAFDEMPRPRRSRDFKVGAFAALTTLLLSVLAYAGWNAVRAHHRSDAVQVAVSTPTYQATPEAQPLPGRKIVLHQPIPKRYSAPAASLPPIIKRVFVKQIVVKEVQSQGVPAHGNAPAVAPKEPRPAGPDGTKRGNAARLNARKSAPTNALHDNHSGGNTAVTNRSIAPATDHAPPKTTVGTTPSANTAPSSQPVIAAVPKPAAPAPVVAAVQTTAPALTARDFVASTIRTAAPDTKINSLWVSDGGGDVTIVEAESTNRGGAFYDKYAVRPSSGSFVIASHEQIPVDLTSPNAAKSPSASVQRKARALFGHIRTVRH